MNNLRSAGRGPDLGRNLLGALLLIFVCSSPSGCPGLGFATPAFGAATIFGPGDGLPSNQVYSLHGGRQDSVWLGTAGGLASYDYDLARFTQTVGAPQGQIWSILEDRAGALWVGTKDGRLARREGVSWCGFGPADGLPPNTILSIAEDSRGNFWVGTDKAGLYRRIGDGCPSTARFERETAIDPTATVNAFCEAQDGVLWVGTSLGIYRFNGTVWSAPSPFDTIPEMDIAGIVQDHLGAMWIAGSSGVGRFDGQSFVWYPNGLPTPVTSILADRDGTIYVGTFFGLARLAGDQWVHLGAAEGVAQNHIWAMIGDRRGAIWLGTEFGGATRFDKVEWSTYGVANSPGGILDNNVECISRSQTGEIWIGSFYGGVSVFDGRSWAPRNGGFAGLGLPDGTHISSLHQDRLGVMWAATSLGLASYNGSQWVMSSDSTVAGRRSLSICVDSSGGLWFGSDSNGVVRFRAGTWVPFTTADNLPSNHVKALLTDHAGVVWAGTDNGLAAFDGSRWIQSPTCNPDVRCLFEDRAGGLWIGTFGGLEHRRGTIPECMTTADGLVNDVVQDILEDDQGAMWFATQGGVSRLYGGIWGSYTASSGLGTDLIGGVVESNGELWFANSAGVVSYRPDRLPPLPTVTSGPRNSSASRNQTINFGVAFRESDGIHFSYAFEGGAWSGWSEQTFWADVLPDGNHSFKLRCRDGIGNLAPDSVAFTFTIDSKPPSPAITYPVFRQAVRGDTTVTGTTADPRFLEDSLWVRPTGAGPWVPQGATLLAHSSAQVTGGPLARWNTRIFPDGLYDLRLAVTDSLGLTGLAQVTVIVDNEPPYAGVTTPAKVSAATGGDVYTTNSEAHLYFPPHAFGGDVLVTVSALADSMVPENLPSGSARVLSGYEIAWGDSMTMIKGKAARLRLSYANAAGSFGAFASPSATTPGRRAAASGATLAVYRSTAGSAWKRLGGTVNADSIELAIDQQGRYALFAETSAYIGGRTLDSLSFTPRVFSPTGGFGNTDVGISFMLGRPAPVTVRVYTRSGRLVKEVASGQSMNAGANLVRWDGRDRNGGYATDGLYLVTVEALGRTERKTLAVVK